MTWHARCETSEVVVDARVQKMTAVLQHCMMKCQCEVGQCLSKSVNLAACIILYSATLTDKSKVNLKHVPTQDCSSELACCRTLTQAWEHHLIVRGHMAATTRCQNKTLPLTSIMHIHSHAAQSAKRVCYDASGVTAQGQHNPSQDRYLTLKDGCNTH